MLALLRYFCSRPGELITQKELLDQVWADRRVEAAAVKTAMAELRRYLDDHDRDQPVIRTVVRRGYLFVPAVTDADGPPEDSQPPGEDHRVKWVRWAVASAVLLALLILWPGGGDQGNVTAADRVALVPATYPPSSTDQQTFSHLLRALMVDGGHPAVLDAKSIERTLLSIRPRDQSLSEEQVLASMKSAHGAVVSLATSVARAEDGWIIQYLLTGAGREQRGQILAQSLGEGATQLLEEVPFSRSTAGSEDVPEAYIAALTAESEERLEEAIAHYQALLKAQPDYLQAKLRLADVLTRAGYHEQSLMLHRQILSEEAGKLSDAALSLLLLSLAESQRSARQYEAAGDTIDRLAAEFADRMDNLALARVHRQRGMLERTAGNPDAARREFSRAKALLVDSGSPADEIELLNAMGSLEFHFGNLYQAVAHYRAGAALAAEFGLVGSERRLSRNLASALRSQGQWQEADDILTTAYDQAAFLGDTRGQAYTALSHSLVKLALGDGQGAVEQALTAVGHAEALEDWLIAAHSHDVAAEALAKMGAIDRAVAHFDEAIERADRVSSPNDRWLFELQKADALHRAGRIPAPREKVAEALNAFGDGATPSYLAIAHFYLGQYDWITNRCAGFATALNHLTGRGQHALESETALTFADCLIDAGELGKAQELVDGAGVWKADYYLYAAVNARLLWAGGNRDAAIDQLTQARDWAGDHWTPRMQERLVAYTTEHLGGQPE